MPRFVGSAPRRCGRTADERAGDACAFRALREVDVVTCSRTAYPPLQSASSRQRAIIIVGKAWAQA